MDEAKLRGQAESRLQSMRKEKSKLEADLEAKKSTLQSATTLIEQTKALHQACLDAEATIKKLSDKKGDQLKVPDLDQTALEALEKELTEK